MDQLEVEGQQENIMGQLRKAAGFTLVELMITLFILAIIASMAAPSFSDMVRRNKRVACGNELVGALQLGRSDAVRSGQPVSVDAPAGIENGIVVFRDEDGDGNADADEIIQQTAACDGVQVLVTAGVIDFTYRPDGQTDMADNLVLDVCDATEAGEQGRSVSILTSGVLRTARQACN